MVDDRVTHRLLLHILQDLQEICRLSVAIVGSCWFMVVHVGSWFCDVLWSHGLLMVGVSGVLILKDPKPMTNA
jgi:hypothetical protein